MSIDKVMTRLLTASENNDLSSSRRFHDGAIVKVSCNHVIGDRSKTNFQPFFVHLFIGKVEKGQEEDGGSLIVIHGEIMVLSSLILQTLQRKIFIIIKQYPQNKYYIYNCKAIIFKGKGLN